ncbi:hypothetical protein [Geoalkalibacter sp.]|uniref:hypothetical protein n=1 Tax=Geoalkalibacter sp. TaxID=3041440 RepID=UPI00272E9682|nr:hypothetical protein [Geoalkalibacter sp.]
MENLAISVGDAIEARCTKCQKNTLHVILSLAEKAPENVRCPKCGREHKYRPPTKTKDPESRRVISQQKAEHREWEDLRESMNSDAARDYSMTGAYKVKSLINHPVFGVGLVQRLVGSQKMEVLFEGGKKMMRCK